jgi:hypothetical protein
LKKNEWFYDLGGGNFIQSFIPSPAPMWGIPGLNVRWHSADESFSPRPDNKEDEEKKTTKGKKVGGGGGKVRNFISNLMVTI